MDPYLVKDYIISVAGIENISISKGMMDEVALVNRRYKEYFLQEKIAGDKVSALNKRILVKKGIVNLKKRHKSWKRTYSTMKTEPFSYLNKRPARIKLFYLKKHMSRIHTHNDQDNSFWSQ